MKKVQLLLFDAGLLLASPWVYAQTIRVNARVPFDFIVNGTTLPAGEYTVQSLSNDGKTLFIRSKDLKDQTLVMSISCQSLNPSDKTKLVFHRYGNSYFLSRIWVAGNSSGHELLKSRGEIEMARDYNLKEVVVAQASH